MAYGAGKAVGFQGNGNIDTYSYSSDFAATFRGGEDLLVVCLKPHICFELCFLGMEWKCENGKDGRRRGLYRNSDSVSIGSRVFSGCIFKCS